MRFLSSACCFHLSCWRDLHLLWQVLQPEETQITDEKSVGVDNEYLNISVAILPQELVWKMRKGTKIWKLFSMFETRAIGCFCPGNSLYNSHGNWNTVMFFILSIYLCLTNLTSFFHFYFLFLSFLFFVFYLSGGQAMMGNRQSADCQGQWPFLPHAKKIEHCTAKFPNFSISLAFPIYFPNGNLGLSQSSCSLIFLFVVVGVDLKTILSSLS